MNEFEIFNETDKQIKELDDIKKISEFTLNYLNISNCIFNIIIVDDDKIRQINKNYRNKDSVTDVISFALEDDKTFIKTDVRILGDIYICFQRAYEQAISYNHSFKREILFLTVHGILHLLGYDHIKKEDELIMFDLQERILNEYGIER